MLLGNLYYNLGAKTDGLTKAEKAGKRFVDNFSRGQSRAGKASQEFGKAMQQQAMQTQKAMGKSTKATSKFAKTTQREFDKTRKSGSRLMKVLATLITGEAIRRVVMLADKYQILDRRMRTATESTGNYRRASQELKAISNRTGIELKANVKVYQDLARVQNELDTNPTEILKLTEAVGQLGVISGSEGQDIKFALRQFTQGLSMGVFRAEEMNSILENMPELAVRMAKGMNMTTGELRLAVLEGTVLSKDVFDSLIKQVDEIDQDFQKIPLTIDRASTIFKNSFMEFVGGWDNVAGLTTWIAEKMKTMADFMRGDFSEAAEAFADWLVEAKHAVSGYVDLFKDAVGYFGITQDALDGFLSSAQSFAAAMWKGFVEAPDKIRKWQADNAAKANYDKSGSEREREIFNLEGELRMAETHLSFKKFMNSTREIPIIEKQIKGLRHQIEMLKAVGPSMEFGDMEAGFDSLNDAAWKAGALDRKKRIEKEKRWIDRMSNYPARKPMADIVSDEVAAAAEKERKKQQKVQDELDKALRKRWKKVEDSISTEVELENKKHEQQTGDIIRMAELEEWSTVKKNRLLEKEEERHQDALADIKEKKQREFDRKHKQIKKSWGRLGEVDTNVDKELTPRIERMAEEFMTELDLEKHHYEQQLNLINAAEANKIATLIPYQEMREKLEAEHQQRLSDIAMKEAEKRSSIEKAALVFGYDFSKSIHKKELRQESKAFEEQINAAAEHSKQFFYLQKALALASALIEGPEAILSAYKFGNKIGGPPVGAVMAGIASAAVATQVAAIQTANFQGGKARGGDVYPGGMYRVNEQGTEMLSAGGKDYLLTGNKGGSITPADKIANDNNTKVIVNVYPLEGQTASVNKTQTGDGTQIDVVIERVEQGLADGIHRGGSPLSDALENRYHLNRAAGGR